MSIGPTTLGLIILIINHGKYLCCPTECTCDIPTANTVKCAKLPNKPIPNDTSILKLEAIGLSSLDQIDWVLFPSTLSELYLGDNQISILTDKVFQRFKNLSILSINNNNLHEIPRNIFNNASNLLQLDLSNNNIQSLTSETFNGLNNVLILNLSYNYLEVIENTTFQSIDNLQTLDLRYNNEIDTSNVNLQVVSNSLQNLYLQGCGIEINGLVILENLIELTNLDLTDNYIPCIYESTFPKLQKLQHLSVNNCSIINISSNVFRNSMPALVSISMDLNLITEFRGNIFNGLSQLTTISLQQMPYMEYMNTQSFRGIPSLEFLFLSNNPHLSFLNSQIFVGLKNLQYLDIGYNHLSRFQHMGYQDFQNITINLQGNNLTCDCDLSWIKEHINGSDEILNLHFLHSEKLECSLYENNSVSIMHINSLQQNLCDGHYDQTTDSGLKTLKIGSSVRIPCDISGYVKPTVTWNLPSTYFHLHMGHPSSVREHPSTADIKSDGSFHTGHNWHDSGSYYFELKSDTDRIVVLQDGSLYIDYVLRSDNGQYSCIVQTLHKKYTKTFTIHFYDTMKDVKIMSFVVGLACAASFFMLNIIYASSLALARRCVNQRRREAIVKLVDNLEQYKTTQMARLRDNYNSQLAQIRDKYHQRLEHIRSNYTSQVLRVRNGASSFKEGASNKVGTIRGNYKSVRENYYNQLGKLKDYSSTQLSQLREGYSNQVLKIRDYGSLQLGRFHHKYKLKQQHVMQLLEMMKMDNCRNMFDNECVRTESMILETHLADPEGEEILPSPLDSANVSDSEYVTATDSEDNDDDREGDVSEISNPQSNTSYAGTSSLHGSHTAKIIDLHYQEKLIESDIDSCHYENDQGLAGQESDAVASCSHLENLQSWTRNGQDMADTSHIDQQMLATSSQEMADTSQENGQAIFTRDNLAASTPNSISTRSLSVSIPMIDDSFSSAENKVTYHWENELETDV